MRKKIAAGNWKMNNTREEAIALVEGLMNVGIPDDTQVILGIPSLYIAEMAQKLSDSAIEVAAQNCHQKTSGAYTGEISAPMIKSVGVKYVIIGHSERREYFGETDAILAEKTSTALDEGLSVIFCCGEPLSVREAGEHVSYVKNAHFLSGAAYASLVVHGFDQWRSPKLPRRSAPSVIGCLQRTDG